MNKCVSERRPDGERLKTSPFATKTKTFDFDGAERAGVEPAERRRGRWSVYKTAGPADAQPLLRFVNFPGARRLLR